jgi:uncharacterized tellurite resistance protein B-like protein
MTSGQSGSAGWNAKASAAGDKIAETAKSARSRIAATADAVQAAARSTGDRALTKTADLAEGVAATITDRKLRRDLDAADLTSLPDEAKLTYCMILAEQARVDHSLDPREIANLYLFASTVQLDQEARGELRRHITGAFSADSGSVEDGIELARRLSELLDVHQRQGVLMSLLRDLVRISRADRHVSDDERSRTARLAEYLMSEDADKAVESCERLVTLEEKFSAGDITTSEFEKTTTEVVAKSAAFGVPLYAVSVAGSVAGLSAPGITSGLAMLGFGGLLGLSAMVTGIGTIVILGVAVHQGTRFVLKSKERDRNQRREHLIQQVIVYHQQAIAELGEDIAGLAFRLEDYLGRTTRNEEGLASLRTELAAFQSALVDLQANRQNFERGRSDDGD